MNHFKKLMLICITILMITSMTSKKIQASGNDDMNEHIHKYDCRCDLSIKVKDINLEKEDLYVGENYNGIAIVTLEVKNNDIVGVELSNIDIYPYQDKTLTKCFVTTAEGDVNGMIGYLNSGDVTDVKIGVALKNLENPLELEFRNVDENQDYKVKEYINLDDKNYNSSNF